MSAHIDDLRVTKSGPLASITPLTPAGHSWTLNHLPAASRTGETYLVHPSKLFSILQVAAADGLRAEVEPGVLQSRAQAALEEQAGS